MGENKKALRITPWTISNYWYIFGVIHYFKNVKCLQGHSAKSLSLENEKKSRTRVVSDADYSNACTRVSIGGS